MSENVFDKALISDEEWSKVLISRLSSRPNAQTAHGSGGFDAKAMKAAFDAQGNLLKERHNTLVNYARAEEGARAAAEAIRRENEEDRIAAETVRINAEALREQNESFRNLQENTRVDMEIERNNNEKERDDNEGERISAELSRQEAETLRKDAEERRNALAGDLDAALDELHAYAQALIGGGGA